MLHVGRSIPTLEHTASGYLMMHFQTSIGHSVVANQITPTKQQRAYHPSGKMLKYCMYVLMRSLNLVPAHHPQWIPTVARQPSLWR